MNSRGLGRSAVGLEDVADVAFGAVGWVELSAAFDELFQFVFEGSELFAALADVGELCIEEGIDVGAGRGAAVANLHDAFDLGQRETCGLGRANEPKPSQGRVVIHPVAVGGPVGLWEQASAFIETHRPGR